MNICQIHFLRNTKFVFIFRKLWWWSDCRLDSMERYDSFWHLLIIAAWKHFTSYSHCLVTSGKSTLIHYYNYRLLNEHWCITKVLNILTVKPCNEMKRFDYNHTKWYMMSELYKDVTYIRSTLKVYLQYYIALREPLRTPYPAVMNTYTIIIRSAEYRVNTNLPK